MNPKVLSNSLELLGWTQYCLAQKIDKLRETKKGTGNYISTVKKVLDNPEKSASKTLEDLFKAMKGELFIEWKKTEPVVVNYKEEKLSYFSF